MDVVVAIAAHAAPDLFINNLIIMTPYHHHHIIVDIDVIDILTFEANGK